jgi:phage terminase small subunit
MSKRLPMPAKPASLTPRREMFCHHVAAGMTQTNAYRQAFSTPNGAKYATVSASKLMKREDIQQRIEELKEYVMASRALSKNEKRAFLADIVRTPIGEIDEKSPLAKEVTYDITDRPDGSTTTVKKVKAHDKLAALAEDSKLSGDYYADQPENRQNPFLFIVAFAENTAIGRVEKNITPRELEE